MIKIKIAINFCIFLAGRVSLSWHKYSTEFSRNPKAFFPDRVQLFQGRKFPTPKIWSNRSMHKCVRSLNLLVHLLRTTAWNTFHHHESSILRFFKNTQRQMQKRSELVPSASVRAPSPSPALVCFQICCDGTLPCTTYNRNVQSARNGKHSITLHFM